MNWTAGKVRINMALPTFLEAVLHAPCGHVKYMNDSECIHLGKHVGRMHPAFLGCGFPGEMYASVICFQVMSGKRDLDD